MDLNRSDLLRLLSVLEGELQAREVVIAVLKAEQIKRLLYPEREKSKFLSNNKYIDNSSLTPSNIQDRSIYSDPYSALFRDSCAGFDSTFNENSIRDIFMLRQNDLEMLIYKQKKLRNYLKNQINELTIKYNLLFQELEIEKQKNIEFNRDKIINDMLNLQMKKKELDNGLESMKEQFKEERNREKEMITYLLAERKQLIIRLIEEKQKNSELVEEYNIDKGKIADMVEGLEEEAQKSLQMELDLQKISGEFIAKNQYLKEKLVSSEKKSTDLNKEIENLRQEIENLKSGGNDAQTKLGVGIRSTIVTMNSSSNGAGISNISTITSVSSLKASIATKPVTEANTIPTSSADSQYATIQAKPSPSNTGTIKAAPNLTKPPDFKAKKATFDSGKSEKPHAIKSPVPPLPSTNPPPIPQSKPTIGSKVGGGKKPTPPPVPPNKPVLPPQTLKEKSKELNAAIRKQLLPNSPNLVSPTNAANKKTPNELKGINSTN